MSVQDPDWITFRGRQRQLLSYPLDAYLRDLPTQPDLRLRGFGRDRGYVAWWHVGDDDLLWLTDLTTRPEPDGPDPGLATVFPSGEPVVATWVSCRLLTADGQQLRFSPFGNGGAHARETYLSVWHGRLVMIEEMDGKTGRRIGGEVTPHLDSALGPDHGAFVRAVVAAGADVAPRLVYADWLDEHNDGRGALIRLAEGLLRERPELAARQPSYFAPPKWLREKDQLLWLEAMGYRSFLPELVRAVERESRMDL